MFRLSSQVLCLQVLSKKCPYGQGGMLAFFYQMFVAVSKAESEKNNDLWGSWGTIFESFCYSDVLWGIHVPQEWPKVVERVNFRVTPGLLGHSISATSLIWNQK